MRVVPAMLVVICIAGCRPPGKAASPYEAVCRYLLAKTPQDRLLYVRDADSVGPLLRERPLDSKFGFDKIGVDPPERLDHPGEWYMVRAATRSGSETNLWQFFVGRGTDAFQIDWKASVGYNPSPLSSILHADSEPRRFRLKARLTSYYNRAFWATETSFQSVHLCEEGTSTNVHGYFRRDTDLGRRLSKLIADGADHPVTLDLCRVGPHGEPITDPEADSVTITGLVSDSWLE